MEVLTSYTTWQFTLKAQFSLPQLGESLIKTPEPNSIQDPKKYSQLHWSWHITGILHIDWTACMQLLVSIASKNSWSEMSTAGAMSVYITVTVLNNKPSGKWAGIFQNTSSWPLSFTSLINPHHLNEPSQDLEGSFLHKYPNHKLHGGAQLTNSAALLAFQGWSAEAGDRHKCTNLNFF